MTKRNTEKVLVYKAGDEWVSWIPPRGPQDYDHGDVAGGAIHGPYGDTYHATFEEACEFVRKYTHVCHYCDQFIELEDGKWADAVGYGCSGRGDIGEVVPHVPDVPGVHEITIPGWFLAKAGVVGQDVTITKLVFMPSASDAGYFGPHAVLWDSPEGSVVLDIEETDGPFWTAMQKALANDDPRIAWEE